MLVCSDAAYKDRAPVRAVPDGHRARSGLEPGVARGLLGPVLAGDCELVYDQFCERVWGPAVTVYPPAGQGVQYTV